MKAKIEFFLNFGNKNQEEEEDISNDEQITTIYSSVVIYFSCKYFTKY
jgi:hypothetical protein